MIEIKKDHWWPTPIWFFDLNPTTIDFEKVKDEIYRVRSVDKGRKISNYGGWQSNDLDLSQDTEMNKLMKNIEEAASYCFDDVGARPSANRKITDYWININKKGDSNIPHVHALSTFSGVVYIECEEDSGNILFHNNAAENYYYLELTHSKDKDKNNPYQFSHVFYSCIKYRVLIFPSILLHSVEPNKSDKDRISLAFNFAKNW
jgi:hypothetical protein